MSGLSAYVPSPTNMMNMASQAVSFAWSPAGVEYGLSKSALDTATYVAESALAPMASGVFGNGITGFLLRSLNNALSLGIQLAFTGGGGDATNPGNSSLAPLPHVPGASADRASVTGF